LRLRYLLTQKVTIDHVAKDLPEAVTYLRERTGVYFVLDATTIRAQDANPSPVVLKATDMPLYMALNGMLSQHRLSYAAVGELMIITDERAADTLRLRQLVQSDLQGVPLKTALQQLSSYAGVNIILDPRLRNTKLENEPVWLQVRDVSVYNAVRLLAEFTNQKLVRIGNVLVVTSPEHAARMDQEAPSGLVPASSVSLKNNSY
jgi:hypothetical protein